MDQNDLVSLLQHFVRGVDNPDNSRVKTRSGLRYFLQVSCRRVHRVLKRRRGGHQQQRRCQRNPPHTSERDEAGGWTCPLRFALLAPGRRFLRFDSPSFRRPQLSSVSSWLLYHDAPPWFAAPAARCGPTRGRQLLEGNSDHLRGGGAQKQLQASQRGNVADLLNGSATARDSAGR